MGISPSVRRFAANRGAIVGGAIVVLLVGIALIGPLVAKNPIAIDVDHGLSASGAPLPPSATALLGTDDLGRDVWARVVSGAGSSLAIATAASALALVLGLAIGLAAGYAGGLVDGVLMRLVDLVLAFPALLLVILLASLVRETSLAGGSAPVVLVLGLVGWTTIARVVRGKAMQLARRDHVVAARALGASPVRIVVRHVLPGVAGIAIVLGTLAFA